MTNTHWLDAWRTAHDCINDLRDAEDPDDIKVAHRRAVLAVDHAVLAVLAVDHAVLEAFARGVEQGKAKKEDDSDAG